MAKNLVHISEQSGVNIIACTGFHKTEFLKDTSWLEGQTEESLTQIYIREAEEGMEGLNARAGLIKCAAILGGHNANSTYAKLFSAAANAAGTTGAPVFVHFDPGADAFSVVDYFVQKNIKPDRLILCHLDRTMYDTGYHMELAQAGVYLEYDTIHREKYHSDEAEAALIEHMVNEGYEKSLLLGLDTTSQRLKSYGAAFGLDDILTRFRFVLEERLGPETVNIIMIDNPKEALLIKE